MKFKSAGVMLMWAFRMNAESAGAKSQLGGSGVGGWGGGGCLSSLEQRAQAAQIVAWVATLPLGERLVLLGMYNEAMHKQTVAFGLVGLVPSDYGIPAAQLAVLRWLDARGGITKGMLADKMARDVRTADRYFGRVAKNLDAVRKQALDLAAARFEALLEVVDRRASVAWGVDASRVAVAI